jgi:hypothetical protein
VTVIPLRIRDVTPKAGLRYYLDELHWLDALTPPLAQHLDTLTARVAYVLTFNTKRLAEVKEGLPPTKSGIYIALSDDGIKWSSPVKLISTYSQRALGLSISIEPTLILDNQDGLAGWLVYAYTPKYSNGTVPGIPLYLVGRRIEFKNPGARADPKTQDVK